MTLPTVESLHELTHGALMALVLQLAERLERLEAEFERLTRPPTHSHNSSQPPSRVQTVDRLSAKRWRHRGAKAGHVKAERSLTNIPDRVIEVRPSACRQCGRDLRTLAPERTVRRQVSELPEIRPVMIETRQHEVTCPAARECACYAHG